MKAAPTTSLRLALQLALVVARQGEAQSPVVACPPRLRPLLSFAKAPATALELCRRVVDEDEAFRARVATSSTVEEVGAIGWLWLTRPDGWEATAAELQAQLEREHLHARVARGQDELERRQQAAEAAATHAEQARRVAVAAMEAAQAEAAEARRRQRELTAERDRAMQSLEAIEDERRQLLRQLKAVEAAAAVRTAELSELRARLGPSALHQTGPTPSAASDAPGAKTSPATTADGATPDGAATTTGRGAFHPGLAASVSPDQAIADLPQLNSSSARRANGVGSVASAGAQSDGAEPGANGDVAGRGRAREIGAHGPSESAGQIAHGGDGVASVQLHVPNATTIPKPDGQGRAKQPDGLREAVRAASTAAEALARALNDAARALDEPDRSSAASDASAGSDVIEPTAWHHPVSAPALQPAPKAPAPRTGAPGPRRALRMPPGTFEDGPQAAWHLSRVPNVVLLVDGYNVSKLAWPLLELPHQRERLIDALVTLQARTGARAEVVFDGVDEGNTPVRHAPERLHVEFTAGDREADDRLLELVDTTPLHRPVVVVSTDRRVRDGARRRGANTLSAAQLLSLLR